MTWMPDNEFEAPFVDETVMSFLTRIASNRCISVNDLTHGCGDFATVTGRLGERRSFDWKRLSRKVNVAPDALYKMSERSFVMRRNDRSRLTDRSLGAFPWAQVPGYPVYSPAALARSDHLRLSWLRPAVLVDATTETLFLLHCPECGFRIGRIQWRKTTSLCPACGYPLGSAPIVKAPVRIVEFAEAISTKIDQEYRILPLRSRSEVMTNCIVMWHIVWIFEANPRCRVLAEYLADEIELDLVPAPVVEELFDVNQAALLHAQLWLVAGFIPTSLPVSL